VGGATDNSDLGEGEGYDVTGLMWMPNLVDFTKFGYEQIYTAKITLNATSGYTFTGMTEAQAAGFTVAGSTGAPTINNNGGNTLTLHYTFPKTAAAPADEITHPGENGETW
jgi:hypothetical protein